MVFPFIKGWLIGTTQNSSLASEKSSSYHRDIFGRVFEGRRGDCYLDPKDGRLSDLVVQCTPDILCNGSGASWSRVSIRNQSPYLIRLANWVNRHAQHGSRPSADDVLIIMAKWFPACVGLTATLFLPVSVSTQSRRNCGFEPFLYANWEYPYAAKNESENKGSWTTLTGSASTENSGTSIYPTGILGSPGIEKPREPQYLCFLDSRAESGMRLEKLSDWKARKNAKADYVFVSYTTTQFFQAESWDYLHEVGKAAALAADVPAYWVACSCLGNERELASNVWLMNDVLRNAKSVIVAVSSMKYRSDQTPSLNDLLTEWGKRAWTLQEVLLAPGGTINIYNQASGHHIVRSMDRRKFTDLWDDAELSGQLIDHYECSLHLTPLQLQALALQCLHNRDTGPEYLPGDMSYVLMGLLRQRPTVVRTDSAFQAFVRLSLANHSNHLLERLICLLPKSPQDPWHWTTDHWDSKLWDINPKCQVCGIGDYDTVFLANVRAAPIRWKSLAQVRVRLNETNVRGITRIAVRLVPIYLIVGTIMVVAGCISSGLEQRILLVLGSALLGVSAFIILLLPYLIKHLYHTKTWALQPWLFGIEGHMDLFQLEYLVFGENLGRLHWSTAGSRLSWHSEHESRPNICEGQDPYLWRDFKPRIKRALNSSLGEEKIFTLVDTVAMEVTLFAAANPPVAALICGEEGGKQRALLCSYEWETNTLYRETVLRMDSTVYDRMSLTRRVKLGLRRPRPKIDV